MLPKIIVEKTIVILILTVEVPGMYVTALTDGNEVIETLKERITGRCLAEDILDENGDVLFNKNTIITAKELNKFVRMEEIR